MAFQSHSVFEEGYRITCKFIACLPTKQISYLLQSGKGLSPAQLQFEKDLIRSQLISLKQMKEQLERMQHLPLIPEKIIVINGKIGALERNLQKLEYTYNNSH